MRQLVKRAIEGTPLEPLVAKLVGALRRAPDGPSIDELNKRYDRQAEQVMARVLERDSNCIDVGCHQGSVLDLMLQAAPNGQFYAFEPIPDLFSSLCAKYRPAANVHLFQAALSDEPGTASFQHVVSNPGYSGLRQRTYSRPDEQVVELDVELLRLDDVISSDVDVRLIKIDVEGAELQVFRGAVETIRRCRPYIVFEHGLGAADCYGTRPEMVYDVLHRAGLQISTMSDWLSSSGSTGFSREAFIDQFDQGRNFYFLAHPTPG